MTIKEPTVHTRYETGLMPEPISGRGCSTRGHSLDWNILDHRLHVWWIKFRT